jgi:hypothetical protein
MAEWIKGEIKIITMSISYKSSGVDNGRTIINASVEILAECWLNRVREKIK